MSTSSSVIPVAAGGFIKGMPFHRIMIQTAEVLEVLSHPATGNLILLAAALVGVLGSYLVYKIRISNRRKAVRVAIISELEAMDIVEQWTGNRSDIPAQPFFPTGAYEGNVQHIGLLSEIEVELIAKLYSNGQIIEELLEYDRERELQVQLAEVQSDGTFVDTGEVNRKDVIKSRINHLQVDRWKCLNIINGKLDREAVDESHLQLPQSKGDRVHSDHPFIRNNRDTFIEKEYLEEDETNDSLYILTKKGEEELFEDL